MKVVQELVAYFDRRGKLSRRQLRRLLAENFVAADAPATMNGLCDKVGTTFYFRVTGTLEGQLWGTDVYGHDSAISAVAVHSGALKPGETGHLRLIVSDPPERLVGSARNGVTSTDFEHYKWCYRVETI